MKSYIFSILSVISLLCCSCQSDDINEIFASGQTWHWSGSYDTSNWKDENKFTPTLTQDEVSQINKNQEAYIIQFQNDGTVTGKGDAITIEGNWSANGDDNSFSIKIKSDRSPTGLDQTFFDEISNAKFYRGDSKTIKLFNLNKDHYIQFYPVGFRD